MRRRLPSHNQAVKGRWRARGARARGQSMVEFALALPVFCALLFGSLEMGMIFKTRAAYQEATQEAVRVAAAAGGTDQMALDELKIMLPVENMNNITSVTVFDATLSTTVPPASSMAMYTVYHYNPATAGFDQVAGASWDPSSRQTTIGSLDRMGIQIVFKYSSLTGVFAPLIMAQTASTLMEPSSYGS